MCIAQVSIIIFAAIPCPHMTVAFSNVTDEPGVFETVIIVACHIGYIVYGNPCLPDVPCPTSDNAKCTETGQWDKTITCTGIYVIQF